MDVLEWNSVQFTVYCLLFFIQKFRRCLNRPLGMGNDLSRLIASKIKVCVYIIYVCVVCIINLFI